LAHLIWWRAWGGVGGLAVNTNYNKIAREIVQKNPNQFRTEHSIAGLNRIIQNTHKPNSHKMRSLAILNKLRPWLEGLDPNLIARKRQTNVTKGNRVTNLRRRINNFKNNLKRRPGETPTRHQERVYSIRIPFNRGTNVYAEAWNAKKQATRAARLPWTNNKGVLYI
jgi:polyhydroxyalkanoate synthesis regulator phasin